MQVAKDQDFGDMLTDVIAGRVRREDSLSAGDQIPVVGNDGVGIFMQTGGDRTLEDQGSIRGWEISAGTVGALLQMSKGQVAA